MFKYDNAKRKYDGKKSLKVVMSVEEVIYYKYYTLIG